MVRAHAQEWNLIAQDRHHGFSAGAELAAPAAVAFDEFDQANARSGDPLAGVSSRPDFVGLVYPGPTPFARNANTPVPETRRRRSSPAPARTTRSTPTGRINTGAMLKARIPNLEMHIYGDGVHANGLKDRNDTRSARGSSGSSTGSGIWAGKPGSTKAAKDIAAHVAEPAGQGRGGR